MNQNEQQIMKIEDKLAYLLGKIYLNIPWKSINVSNAHKFFIERIRASTNTPNFKEFIDLLCKKLNIEIIRLPCKEIDYLNENNNITMKLLRKESLYICNFALEKAEQIKKGGID